MDDIKSSLRTPGATASVLGYYRAIFSGDQTGSAAAEPITVPALMITGDDGPGIRTRFEAARHLYTGPYEYLEIPGVGHFPQLEAPDETADAILGLLGPPPASARDGL